MAERQDASGYIARVEFDGDPQYAGVADTMWPDAAEYIALMHPPVGLAIAAWLHSLTGIEIDEAGPLDDEARHAIAVARAILREES